MAQTATVNQEPQTAKRSFNKTKFKDGMAKYVFLVCACMSVVAVFGIIGYILYASIPAFREIGVFDFQIGRASCRERV